MDSLARSFDGEEHPSVHVDDDNEQMLKLIQGFSLETKLEAKKEAEKKKKESGQKLFL